MTNYAANTLAMANNTTNYVFLDTASSCAPGTNTTGYTSSLIPIATVITSGGVITTITDDRTLGFATAAASVVTGGSCTGTNQVVVAISTTGVPTCATLNSTNVNNTIALTGVDINTSNQVTATHLAAALPVNQGGTGTTSTLSGILRGGNPLTGSELSGDVSTSGSNVATLASQYKKRYIGFSYGDPAGTVLTVAATTTSYNIDTPTCTISRYTIGIDTGTITVKFWKVAAGTAIPTSSDSINTSGVGVASGTVNSSTTLSDFTTTSVTARDIMAMNVTAVSGAHYVTATLECDQ
jgi:hypothetical protein